jgi:uncharacterized protein YjbK
MKYYIELNMTYCVIIDDAESLEEAKEIVEDIYCADEIFHCKYKDYHYEWSINDESSGEHDFDDFEEELEEKA